MNLKIEADFRDLLPPLSDEEFAQLKVNLNANPDGFPPIIVWKNYKGGNVIIDGHHQYKARSSMGLPIKVKKLDFETRQDAILFALHCQCGRRNLSASERARIGASLVTTGHGGDRKPDQAAKLPLEKADAAQGLTQKEASKAVGVSERTMRDAVKAKQSGDNNGSVSKAATKARQKWKRISGGTSFDTEEIDAAPAKSARKKAGKPTVSTAKRKECLALHAKLCRALQAIGVYDEFIVSLSQIAERLRQI